MFVEGSFLQIPLGHLIMPALSWCTCPELPKSGRKMSSHAAQWLLELHGLFSHQQTLSYFRIPGGIMESLSIFCRNQAWVQPCLVAQWWPHQICAASKPSTLIISGLHLLTGPVPPLPSTPQDSACEVVSLSRNQTNSSPKIPNISVG